MHSSSPDVPASPDVPTSAGVRASRARGDPPTPAATPDFKHCASREPSHKLKILTIAHNAVAASNRRRVDALRELPGTELPLLTPPWWFEEGRRIDVPRSAP